MGHPLKLMTVTQGLTDKSAKILFCDERHLKYSNKLFFERSSKTTYDVSIKDLIPSVIYRFNKLLPEGYSLVFKYAGRNKILIFNN